MAKPTQRQPENTQPEENHEERIRRRAYELYEQRGRTDGRHEDDWHAAEQEVKGTSKEQEDDKENAA